MLQDRIRLLRKLKGYSQQQMASIINLTQGAISQWENGLTTPSADQLISLADVFGISVDDLLEHTPVYEHKKLELTSEEENVILDYRQLSGEGKEYILQQLAIANKLYHEHY